MQRYFESVFCNINISTLLILWHISWWRHQWKHFPRNWPFVWGIHRSSVNSPHKGQWRGALMSSLICAWIDVRVNNRESGDLTRHRAHYDVNVMITRIVYGVTMTNAGYRLGNWFTKDKPYPPLTGEISSVLENSYLDINKLDCTREIIPWNSCVFASNDLQYLLIG